MRNIIITAALSILVISCGSRANQPVQEKKEESIPVKTALISMDSASGKLHSSGYLSTEGQARLSFKVGGVIDKIYVKEGEKIKRGQLLATLKSTEISSQVQQVQLGLEKAKRDYQRVENLYKDSVATLEQLQNARTGLDIAKQNLLQAGFNQQYSKIYATEDGFIVKKLKNEGELAEPGGPLFISRAVSSSSKWILITGLSDREWAMVKKGDKATVSFDAFPGKEFSSVVSRKALAADPASGVFETEIQVDFGSEQPALGMFGKAAITTTQPVIGYSIPYEALLEANGKSGFVFVTNDGKTAKRIPVTIAGIEQQVVYIAGGLEGYSQVIISGSPYLTDGSLIRIIQ
jgi:RND family efflux transporter MFP subunit